MEMVSLVGMRIELGFEGRLCLWIGIFCLLGLGLGVLVHDARGWDRDWFYDGFMKRL